jgi:hypothetical protein
MAMVAREGLKRAGPGFDRSVAVGFAGCAIAFVLISVVSNVITEVIVLWYYVAFAAAAYAITKFPASEREPEPVSEREPEPAPKPDPAKPAKKVRRLKPDAGPAKG